MKTIRELKAIAKAQATKIMAQRNAQNLSAQREKRKQQAQAKANLQAQAKAITAKEKAEKKAKHEKLQALAKAQATEIMARQTAEQKKLQAQAKAQAAQKLLAQKEAEFEKRKQEAQVNAKLQAIIDKEVADKKAKQKKLQAQAKAQAAEIQAEKLHDQRKKRKQEANVRTAKNNDRERAEFMRSLTDKCENIPNESVRETLLNAVKILEEGDEEKMKELIEKLENEFLPRLVFEGCHERNTNRRDLMAFSFVSCALSDMQLVKGKRAVLPWNKFNDETKGKEHVDHLRGTDTESLSINDAVRYSWWILDLIDCIIKGLNHAFTRKLIETLEGTTAFVFCKLGMVHGDDIFHCPNHQLDPLGDFYCCEQPVFPDFILKITFGVSGFFDEETQIHIVSIHGHECAIKVL